MPRVSAAQASLRLSFSQALGDYVAAVAWSPDGSQVAAACADGAVAVTPAAGGGPHEVARHPGGALCLDWSLQGVLASGGEDGRVALSSGWEPDSPVPSQYAVLDAGRGSIERLAWSPTGRVLAVAQGRRVQLWTPAGECRAVSADLPATVACLGWHPGRRWLAAGSYGGVVLLSPSSADVTAKLAWKGSVLELAFSPDGRRLAHGNQDSSVHFWELPTHGELEMSGYARKVRELAWSPDGRLLATGGGEQAVVWDFAGSGPADSRPVELEGHVEPISALGFQPAGGLLASAGRDGLLHLWRPQDDDLPLGSVALAAGVSALAWSPGGGRLAAGTADGTLALLVARER